MPLIPITVQSYKARSLPFSHQRMLNCYVEKGTQGSKSSVITYGTPGAIEFADVGTGPIRGMISSAGVPCIVSGTNVYTVDSAGTVTDLGSIGGSDNVSMATNGTQVCIVSQKNGYIVEGGTVTKITDPDFLGADSVTYIDGYFVFNNGAIIFNSELNDGLSYNALDFATAEYDPDTALRVFADHNDIFVFGTSTIEAWYNTSGNAFPFSPRKGATMEVGLLARDTVVKLDNLVYWFGADDRGSRMVWMKSGYQIQRVSTHALEMEWDEYETPEQAIAFSYVQEGHSFYVLTLPGKGTYVYDVSTGMWHERNTFNDIDWQFRHYTFAFGKRLVGGVKNGKIYQLDMDTYKEGTKYIERELISANVASDNNSYLFHNFVRIDMETGDVPSGGYGSDATLMVSWSNEGSRIFNNEREISIGRIGNYGKRLFLRMLGKARSRVYKIRLTAPIKFAVMGAYVDIDEGIS